MERPHARNDARGRPVNAPRIHADGTPEWYTPDGEHLVQYVADSRYDTVRLYKVGDIDWEWSGTVEEATQIAQALLDAARYREAQEATR